MREVTTDGTTSMTLHCFPCLNTLFVLPSRSGRLADEPVECLSRYLHIGPLEAVCFNLVSASGYTD